MLRMADVVADPNNFALGATRHAPRADVAAPELERRKPVGTFSRPALDSDVQGTSHLLSGVHHKSPGSQALSFGSGGIESPLSLDSVGDIIGASKLGKRPLSSADEHNKDVGEQMSDADRPTQGVTVDERGQAVHHRRNSSGGVDSTPIGGSQQQTPNYFDETGYL